MAKTTDKVLFVDDEINILKSIQRGFLNSSFDVVTAECAKDGLKILEDGEIDVLVTDYRMPEIDGLQFLKIVKRRYPEVNRVILSGFIEKSIAVESLTRGLASTYILKPWTNEDIEERITHILSMRKILKSKKLLGVINQIENLPFLSNIYQEFMDAVNEEKPMSAISKIIQKDPSIATKVLQVANSAFYGLKNCTSITQASVTLGLDTLQDILLTISILNTMKWKKEHTGPLHDIFLQSFIMNTHLPVVYRYLPESRYYKVFPSIGLTYDVGKIILLQYFPERFNKVKHYMSCHPDKDFYQSELMCGYHEITHQEIGAFFLDCWNLPEIFVETAMYHHTPAKSSVQYRDIAELTAYLDGSIDLLRKAKEIDSIEAPPFPQEGFPHTVIDEMFTSMKIKMKKQTFFKA
jgi:HD-like signal output (HDOD) protein/ActR/RegA family two-component response regulator